METKQMYGAYEAPKVEVIEVVVEQGFAASAGELTNQDLSTGNNP